MSVVLVLHQVSLTKVCQREQSLGPACRILRPSRRRPLRCVASSIQGGEFGTRISSVQNPAVKHCVKLRQSKSYREQLGSALLTGRDLVEEACAAGVHLKALVGLEGGLAMPDIVADRYVLVTETVMAKLTGVNTVPADTLAAEVRLPPAADLLRWPTQLCRVLVLDGVGDPGNLGTLLRTALALGWQAAVLLPGCCDPFNEKAVRASRGACFKLPIAQYSLQQWQQLVQAHSLVALAAVPPKSVAGQQQWQQQTDLVSLQQRLDQLRVCLCLGAEGQGLSPAVLQACLPVSIPQPGNMESLNVGAAGSILMFALSRGAAGPLLFELGNLA